jgi:hypothetical protein
LFAAPIRVERPAAKTMQAMSVRPANPPSIRGVFDLSADALQAPDYTPPRMGNGR